MWVVITDSLFHLLNCSGCRNANKRQHLVHDELLKQMGNLSHYPENMHLAPPLEQEVNAFIQCHTEVKDALLMTSADWLMLVIRDYSEGQVVDRAWHVLLTTASAITPKGSAADSIVRMATMRKILTNAWAFVRAFIFIYLCLCAGIFLSVLLPIAIPGSIIGVLLLLLLSFSAGAATVAETRLLCINPLHGAVIYSYCRLLRRQYPHSDGSW